MDKFTRKDVEKLNDLLPSADAFVLKQQELFGDGFREVLAELQSDLKKLGYSREGLHKHGVLLGMLLAEQQLTQL